MKKIVYAALFFLAAGTVGCKEADNGYAVDTEPKATIYAQALPDGYDADITCGVRICPNAQTEKMYLLAELLTDKEAFVAASGEAAYMNKVVSEGTVFEAKDQEVILENLAGKYALTVVAVNGSSLVATEYLFNGILWENFAVGYYLSGLLPQVFGASGYFDWDATLEHATIDGKEIYRLKDLYHNSGFYQYTEGGHHLLFEWNGGEAIVPQGNTNSDGYYPVATGFLHPNYGMIYITIDSDPEYSGFDPEEDMFIFNGYLNVNAGRLTDWDYDFFIVEEYL